jgi:four helix bundle protein
MKISLKELRETYVCLKIIYQKPMISPAEKLDKVITENNELISIFVRSITTAQSKK